MANSKFWLQVRKDYIFENFENLLQYLRSYDYHIEEDNSDYNDTLSCMEELVTEIGEAIRKSPFFDAPNVLGYDNNKVIKLMMATILTSLRAGRVSYNTILILCEFLTKLKIDLDYDNLIGVYRVIINCMHRKKLVSAGFSWSDVCQSEINIGMLAINVSKMNFANLASNVIRYIENKGLFMLPYSGIPVMFPGSLADYNKSKIYELMNISELIKIENDSEIAIKGADFSQLFEISSRILSLMRPFKKTDISFRQRDYDFDDEFVVKIISINRPVVIAETIDPKFNKILGKVFINPPAKRLNVNNFYSEINIGDYLLVMLSKDDSFQFEIQSSFENSYRFHAARYNNDIKEAKYLSSYRGGDQWVTEDGVRVGIDQSKIDLLDEESLNIYEDIKNNNISLPIKFYATSPDIDAEKFNMYAEPLIEDWRLKTLNDFDIDEAEKVMIRKYLKDSQDDSMNYEENGKQEYAILESKECATLIPVLSRIIEGGVPSSKLKLEYQTALAMLCKICGHDQEFLFIDHDRHFLNSQVQFVSNHPITNFIHTDELDGNENVERKEELIRTLLKYNPTKNIQTLDIESAITEDAEKSKKVSALVEASNNLAGIIDNIEQNNIKQYIARTLDIEDEYVSIIDDRTFYGTESISLEFKASIVYPPANRRRFSTLAADPDMQKWAIIKAVCGFLNTRSGGELLIGVKDSGYACGIEDDIRILAEMHLIMAPTVDQYRIYLQGILDYAFKAYKSTVSSTDIARSSILYLDEINEEGKTVMRIQIKPFKKNVVMLAAKDSERPAGIEECYVRLSGRTVPVTKTIREQILRYKES
jgi:divergent AAA domain